MTRIIPRISPALPSHLHCHFNRSEPKGAEPSDLTFAGAAEIAGEAPLQRCSKPQSWVAALAAEVILLTQIGLYQPRPGAERLSAITLRRDPRPCPLAPAPSIIHREEEAFVSLVSPRPGCGLFWLFEISTRSRHRQFSYLYDKFGKHGKPDV